MERLLDKLWAVITLICLIWAIYTGIREGFAWYTIIGCLILALLLCYYIRCAIRSR